MLVRVDKVAKRYRVCFSWIVNENLTGRNEVVLGDGQKPKSRSSRWWCCTLIILLLLLLYNYYVVVLCRSDLL